MLLSFCSLAQKELQLNTGVFYLPTNFLDNNDFQKELSETSLDGFQVAFSIQLEYSKFLDQKSRHGLNCGLEYLSHNFSYNGKGFNQSFANEDGSMVNSILYNKLRVVQSVGLDVNYHYRKKKTNKSYNLMVGLGAYFTFHDAIYGVLENEAGLYNISPGSTKWDFPPERISPFLNLEPSQNFELNKSWDLSVGLPIRLLYNIDSEDGIKHGLKYLVGLNVGLVYQVE